MLKIDILSISETRWPNAGKQKTENGVVYSSGNDDRHHHNSVVLITTEEIHVRGLFFTHRQNYVAITES